ncbi:MAG: DUF3373 domain-containing protein [Campylobacterales bacterium]|nr:DUF3373 domain-containing protein [Campylobacterales bacterium]
MNNISKKLLLGGLSIVLASTIAMANDEVEELAGSVDELDERLETIETQVLMNKISFGLGFRQRMDGFKQTMADGTSFSDSNIWSTKFSLNLKSQIDDRMKFNGRVSMYKYWADQNPNGQQSMDPKQGRVPSNSTFFVERAYVDWTLAKGKVPVVLTMGRQPSSDGPSHQFKDNTVRKSTYSALAFDGATDGIVLTTVLQNLTKNKGNAFRLVYGKGYQEHNTNRQSPNPYTGVKETVPDNVMSGFFFDAAIPGVDNSLFQVGHVVAKDVPEMVTSNGYSKVLGDITIQGVMAEFTNMGGSGLDFFTHYGMSTVKPNGKVAFMPMDRDNDGTIGAGEGMNLGLLGTDTTGANSVSTDEKSGSAIWAGLRYTLPFANKVKIGYEYNKGDKNWVNFSWGANDPMNKLAARGTASEMYIINEINRYSHLRIGMTSIDYDYTNSGNYHGTPMEISTLTPATGSTQTVDKVENTYFLFNLLF